MQSRFIRIRKVQLLLILSTVLWFPLPLLYLDPPAFLRGQPLAVYAIILFLAGLSSSALGVFSVLKSRRSPVAARLYSVAFLLAGIGAYQFSGLAPNWGCVGKQIYATTANAAGQNCTTVCTDNDVKPCSGWSTCWDKFVSCNAAGKDQDGRNCAGCCFSCNVVCDPEPDDPPTIASTVTCSQPGSNGWCRGTGLLILTASDPQGYSLSIKGSMNGTPFTCAPGATCFQPLPQGNGMITYTVTAAQSGMSANGSTSWKLDATPPSINGTLSGVVGANGWYLGPVTYNGSFSDNLSGLSSFTCMVDGASLGSCNSIEIAGDGLHTLLLTANDNAGNTQTLSQSVSIDIQNPNLLSSISGVLGSNNWYNSATLNASASDPAPGSGVAALEYRLDSGSWTVLPPSGMLGLPEGSHTVDIRAVDNAGRTATATRSYSLDSALPDIAFSPLGTVGANGWYTSGLTLSAYPSDATSGIDLFEYSLNNGVWAAYSSSLTLGEGTHNLSFWAQDRAGLVRQVSEIYKVDTRPPQIAGGLSGVPGSNGWYVSQVTISASAADPVPGSGLEVLTYSLNGSPQIAYINSLVLSDGVHTLQFTAQDWAGLTHILGQTVKVDATPPSLDIHTKLPDWSKGLVTLTGSAGDSGSGLSRVEVSTDGGSNWQAVTGTGSWNFDWDTTSGTSGPSQVRVRSTDLAGLNTEQVINIGIDNSSPKISLPDSWFQWDTVTLDVWDNDSGLSGVQVEISDPEGRWKTRKIDLDPNNFPLDFKWDRYFGDGTVAPLGMYSMKVIAYDNMGNLAYRNGTIRILLGILPPGPAATPQPYVRIDSTPIPPSVQESFFTPPPFSPPVTNLFGSAPGDSNPTQDKPGAQEETIPEIVATPRTAPIQSTIMEWLESVFTPNVIEETVFDISTPETDINLHWGATLVAMAAAVTAYTLAEKQKREEEERPLSNYSQKLRAQKTQEMRTEEALMREIAEYQAEQKRLESEKESLVDQMQVARVSRVEELLEAESKSRSAKPQEWQTAYNAYMTEKAMEIYHAGERAEYAPTSTMEKNWWEITKSFVNENIIKPVDTSVYQPLIKPAIMTVSDAVTNGVSWLSDNFYQPVVQPVVKKVTDAVETGVTWLDENLYQPYIKPGVEKGWDLIETGITWTNVNIYQPYVKPELERHIDMLKSGATWIKEKIYEPYIEPVAGWVDENIYQPYVKPQLESGLEKILSGFAWVNENIYQPVFQPVVSDIEQFIYNPLKEKTSDLWDKYGDWVHGSLDAVGFIPGLGDIADGLNGLIYLGEGRYIEATVSAMAMIPLLGDLGKAGKWTVKAGQEFLEEAVEKVIKETAEELLEKAAKETISETVEEIGEKALIEISEELAEKVSKESLQVFAEEAAENATNVFANGLTSKVLTESVETATTKQMKESGIRNIVQNTADDILFKETLQDVAENTARNVVNDLSSKALSESAKNIAENTTRITVDNILEKVAKDTGEALTSASTEKVSKEIKERLVEETLERVEDKTAVLLRSVREKLGDDVASTHKAVALIQKYGETAVKALEAVELEAASKVLRTVDISILDDVVQQGSDAFAAFSGWTEKELKDHGKDLATRATKDAEVLSDVRTLVSNGPIDPKNLTDEQKLLIERIAANSTFNVNGEKVVVGKWVGLDGGFLGRAKETGYLHYSPHPDLWKLFGKLENQNEAAWLINKQVIQTGIGNNLPFEYTLDGIPLDLIDNERAAIKAIFSGRTEKEIKQELMSEYLPVRMKELQELQEYGFTIGFDEINNSYIIKKP